MLDKNLSRKSALIERIQLQETNKRLPSRIYARTMKRVAGDNVDITREMLLEGGDFGFFAGSLTANNRSQFRC
jgi:hypothetical protein